MPPAIALTAIGTGVWTFVPPDDLYVATDHHSPAAAAASAHWQQDTDAGG